MALQCRLLVHNKSKRVFCLMLLCLFVIYGLERCIVYRRNSQKWFKAPINDVYRQCPPPTYPLLADANPPPTICLTTLTDAAQRNVWQSLFRWRNFDNLLEMTWPNKQAYVDFAHYRLFDGSQHLDNTRPPSWSKIRAVQALMEQQECDWIVWLDADTVIMNKTQRIEAFLPAEADFVVTREKNNKYNAGAWIIKNSAWSKTFLERWWNMDSFVQPKGMAVSGDNDALNYFLHHMDENDRRHVVIPPRCGFNAVACFTTTSEHEQYATGARQVSQYEWYLHEWKYHKGDFIAHVAGKDNKITTTQMLLEDAA